MRSSSLPLASTVSFSSISRFLAQASRSMLGLCLLLGGIASSAQTTTFPDPAVPVALVPSLFDSTVYALNQDGTVKEYATEGALNLGYTCPAAPGLAAPGATPNTLAFDGDLYEVGPVTGGGGYGVVGITPPTATGCKYSPVAAIPGSPTSVVAAAGDARHHRLVVLTQDGGNTADKITGFSTGGFFFPPNGALTSLGQASLDQGAQYTALLTDFDGVGDTVVTEFSTPSSPGNLWIYNPASGTAIKVLGPGGVSLPAINAFIIHNPNNLGGGLLVLANQDGLTPANISAPPLDPTPFSIIDLGKLHLLIASLPAGSTSVTVPVITTISATVPYYAMLGAAYNPVNNLLYAVVGSGTDITAVTRTILSYDPTNPAAPAETVVTDVSSIPIFPPVYQQLGFGAATGILQLGLSAGSGTMQFFLPGPNEVYSVGIAAGAANTVSQITGASFPNDSTFKPTAMVENSLVGNTYLASQSGNVDTLTPLPGALHNAYIDLTGSLVQAAVGQDQTVGLFAYFPEVSDTNLGATQITVTAFPEDPIGPSFTFAMDPSTDARGGTQVQGTFLQPGLYALVASFPGDGYFAPARSQPVNVWVAEEIPTQLLLTATSLTPTSGLAKIFLTGSTYTPTGTITVKDFTTGLPLGTFQLTGTLQNPISVNITLAPGTTMVQASYSGDAANQPSISSPVTLTGAVAPIATKLSITGPATAVAGSSFNTLVTMQLASQSANTPTGNIVVTAQLAGGAAIPLTTVTPAQAIAAGGITVATSLPSAGAWTVTATYAGDANFAASTNSFNETVTAAALQATSVGIVAPATATPGTAFNAVISLSVTGAFTTQPTGNLVVTAQRPGGALVTVATITAAQGLAAGGATVAVTLPIGGTYTLSASYAGDTLYAASANTATVTAGATTAATTLGLSGATSQNVGVPFTLTVTLSTPGTPTTQPTGNVTVTATPTGGGAAITLATITAAQALASGGFQAQVTLPSAGNFTVVASYAGDTNFSASTATLVISSGLIGTTMKIGGVTSQIIGVAFPLTVQLTPASGTPSGNVVISATPSGGGAAIALATVTAAQAMTNGGFQAQVTLPTAGSFTVTASYAGDADFAASSASLVITNSLYQPTLQLFGPATSSVGVNTVYTVGLLGTPLSGTTAITTLSSTLNGVAGPSGTINSTGANIPLVFKTPGTYTLTATFAGDSQIAPATSNTLTTVVAPQGPPQSYTLTLDPYAPGFPATIPKASYVDVPFTLAAVNGYTDKIQLTAEADYGGLLGTSYQTLIVDANGKELPYTPEYGTQVTLGAAPLHLKLRLFGLNATVTKNRNPFNTQRKLEYASVIFGILLLGGARRRSWSKTMTKLLVAVLFISAVGSLLAGCIDQNGYVSTVYLTATPNNSNAPGGAAQTVTFSVD